MNFTVPRMPRIVFGAGTLGSLGMYARSLGTRALVVTDRGIVAAGHVERALRSLREADLHVATFDGCTPNPSTDDASACADVARRERIDLFIGLGGGSSLDTAKGANLLLTNGGAIADYWGRNKVPGPMLPMIAVPTTAGTGSEMQSYALISDAKTHVKMACGDDKATPAVALLDPELTLSQPRELTATCGIDALAHAVETAVTTTRNPWSLRLSHDAFRLISRSFSRVLTHPGDLDARAGMMLAAGYAGLAIEASTLGAAHSCANPLTASFGVDHGKAVGAMLPFVIEFNAEDPAAREAYDELARSVGLHGCAALIACVRRLLDEARVPPALATYGVRTTDLPELAAAAATQWTARFNPRPVTEADFTALYARALAGGPP